MALASGTKLGPYEIQSPLGAGGMGEVYRARDTRLERTVAIKVLPHHLSSNPDLKQRFEREARSISSLNHPRICILHDVGHQDGVDFLVMEYLDGETLVERLRNGPLPLKEALRIGIEVCEALEAAHRVGIVHRDLKPGNIMLTKSGAKLMDFGLAKSAATTPGSQSASAPLLSAAKTISNATPLSPLTTAGTVIGTIQYMAPEQIEGKEADARSDLFALGAVLYEMATGKRPFEGKSQISVASAILEKDPEPMRMTQPLTPAAFEHVVETLLAKDPEGRFQSAHDVRLELEWIGKNLPQLTAPAAETVTRPSLPWLPWAVTAAALAVAIALAVLHFAAREPKPLMRTQIASSDKWDFNFVGDNAGPPVISPDGTRLVFSAHAQGKQQLFLRSMDNLTPQPISGTDNATFPFWSPDSRSIGFFAEGKLKRMDISGGPAIIICDAPIGRGASWGPGGTILFSPQFASPIDQVPAAGGTPVAVTKLTEKYTTHRWPTFLPDGKHFLYLAANHAAPTTGETAVFWASVDGKQNKMVVLTPSNALYAPGYLLFVRQNALMAQPFDPSTGELKGQATVLNDDVQVDSSVWRGTFTASDDGTMVYQPGSAVGRLQLTWFDIHGNETGHLGEPDDYNQVELSPDGKKAAASIGTQGSNIWIYDVEHNTRSRFTFGNEGIVSPVWSGDGKQIAYMGGATSVLGMQAIWSKAADGSGEEKKLLDLSGGGLQDSLCDWSPDGRYLLYVKGTASVGTGAHIWVLPLFGDRKPYPYTAAPGNQQYAQFSPDGRWLAYSSDESGLLEVYVAPFRWTGAKWQVSNGGGVLPRWRRDGKEIFFLRMGSASTFAADVDGQGPSFEVGAQHTLYNVNNLSPNTAGQQYSVTADGQRFLQITTGDAGKGRLPLNVIQNWTAQLQGR
jgi:eukaryotic-like serine/threonine-protein kinase